MNLKRFFKKIPAYILAFICSLSLFFLAVLIILKYTMFSPTFMIQQMDTVEYSEVLSKEINSEIEDLGRGSNIPPEILENSVSAQLVEENMKNYVNRLYENEPFELIGESEVTQKINESIYQYAEEKGYAIDDQTEVGISKLTQSSAQIFKQYIELPYFSLYIKKVNLYQKPLMQLMIGTLVLFLLLFVALLFVLDSWVHLYIRYFAYILNGSSLMLIVLPTYLYFHGFVNRIGMASEAIYLFLVSYINHFLLWFIWTGIIGLAISLYIWLVSEFVRRKTLN